MLDPAFSAEGTLSTLDGEPTIWERLYNILTDVPKDIQTSSESQQLIY
jgi:hypothetical protein